VLQPVVVTFVGPLISFSLWAKSHFLVVISANSLTSGDLPPRLLPMSIRLIAYRQVLNNLKDEEVNFRPYSITRVTVPSTENFDHVQNGVMSFMVYLCSHVFDSLVQVSGFLLVVIYHRSNNRETPS